MPSPRPRPLRADAERNRTRILEAARKVFAERGLDVAIEDVAREAGVGVGTFYRRFADKNDLIEALFAARIEELVGLAEAALLEPDPWAALIGFIRASLETQVADRGLREVLLHNRWGREQVALMRDRAAPVAQRLIDRARATGRLREDFAATDLVFIMRMITAAADYAWPVAPELWRRYMGLVLDGLEARRDEARPLAPPPSVELTAEVMATRPELS